MDSIGRYKPCSSLSLGFDTNQDTPAQTIRLLLFDRTGNTSISGLSMLIKL